MLGIVRTVLFAPEDLALVKGDPGERRRFLDELITARSPRMAGVRSDYERVLKQRNTLLKSAAMARRHGGRGMDLSTLDVWDQHLARAGAELLAQRIDLIAALQPLADKAYEQLAPGAGRLRWSTVPPPVPLWVSVKALWERARCMVGKPWASS